MYYLIDEEGYYIDYVLKIEGVGDDVAEDVDGEDGLSEPHVIEIPRYVTLRPPDGMYRPRWSEESSEWVEAKTQEEFEEEEFLQSLIPSVDEITDAEFDIKTLNTLMKVGLL